MVELSDDGSLAGIGDGNGRRSAGKVGGTDDGDNIWGIAGHPDWRSTIPPRSRSNATYYPGKPPQKAHGDRGTG